MKALIVDLKAVYATVDENAALDAPEHWDKKHPKISSSWRDNWPNLSTYFKFPQEIRRLIYTTNAIEGFNRQLRKVTKAKSAFPTDDSLLKMLYLAIMDILPQEALYSTIIMVISDSNHTRNLLLLLHLLSFTHGCE